MRVQHNISAINAYRQLGVNGNATAKALEKLSSGYRINKAGDDAAGLAISEKMRSQIGGLAMAERNALDGISFIQTAEGGLQETHAILQRMRELAVQACNGTYQDSDRENIDNEVQALKQEINRIATATEFNGIRLISGNLDIYGITGNSSIQISDGMLKVEYLTFCPNPAPTVNLFAPLNLNPPGCYATLTIFVSTIYATAYAQLSGSNGLDLFLVPGVTYSESDIVIMTDNAMNYGEAIRYTRFSEYYTANAADDGFFVEATKPGQDPGREFHVGANATKDQIVSVTVQSMTAWGIGIRDIDVLTSASAKDTLNLVDKAVNLVSWQRGVLGAVQNRLEHTINNLGVTKENLTAAESRVRDTDMASEMMEFTKMNILGQAAQSMLAQANARPRQVLQLLRS